jgi:archaeosine synthase
LVAELSGVRSVVVDAGKRLLCMSEATLHDPSVVAWERFMRTTYRAPEGLDRILVLLPCSARKPYRSSPSHRRFIEAIGTNAVHEVMVTSPLGLVPRDLEQVWPAANYDLAVTGRWSGEEVARVERMLRDLIASHGYVTIVDHSGLELPEDVYGNLPRVDTRCGESAGSFTSLERLGDAVREAIRTHGARRRSKDAMLMDEWKSVSRLHFGGDDWLSDVEVRGRPPRYRLMHGGEQVAQWSPERASLALSKASVPLLEQGAELARVHLVPGVVWKGDLHRAIVERVEGEVLGGADVLVLQEGRPVGLARAMAPGWEWSGTPGRLAKAHQRL